MKCYKIKFGDKWAKGGDKGELTDDMAKAKSWKKASHAKSHITQTRDAIQSRWRFQDRAEWPQEHPYFIYNPQIIQFNMVESEGKEGWVNIQLPKDEVLADLLEERGYGEAAKLLRS